MAHLKNAYEYYLSDKGKQLLSYDGNYEQNRAEWERNRDILYPFLEKQTALSIEDNKRFEEFMQTEQEWFKMPDTEQKINAPAQDNVPLNIDRKTYLLNEMVKLTERFVGGKFGVAEFYNSHSKINLSDFADYLAEGYKAAFGKYNGYGDIHPWSLSEKGIDTTEILRKTGETVPLHIGWFVIARNIGECIDEGKFFTQQELDEHAKALNQSEIKPAAESIDWSRFTEKEYDEVKTAIKDKIILDGNDTYTLPLNSDKDLALSIEIQIVPMGEKWAVDYALWSDVMHDYINVGGYYDEDLPNDIDTAELRDYFTNPARAEERERNAAGMLAQAEAVLNEEKSEENSEVKLKSVVIDIANGAVYEQDYPSPERATGGTNSQSENYPAAEKHDFTITDEHLGEGGAKTKFAANVAAIKTLKAIEAENRLATPDEQETLSKYVGWGGIPQAFDSSNKDWQKEYAELRGLLTDSEYEKARGSTLNAHYTTPTVISAIYKALDGFGFKGGNILEPAMGVGNFFGAMPEDLRSNSSLSGVELDDITGRIARQLYQNANIQIKGYEETELPDNFYDVAVGNVPFGSYQVADTKFNRENFLIHDYFFAKTLDKVAPNGIIAFVTSKGTMDKADAKAREYIARRADLIGAIRLPGGRNGAFAANANTEVTTDIIFLQKREQLAVELPDWCYVGKNADGLPVNQYFLDNPEMMLGKMESYKNMYGNDSETACIAPEGQNLAAELDKAVARLQKNLAVVRRDEQRNEERGIVPATVNVRNFTYTEINGKIFFRENNIMREHLDKVKGEFKPLKGKKLERMRGMIEIRELFRKLIDAQTENCSDERLAALQNELNSVYDKFVKRNGHISDSANAAVFRDDDDYNLICGLEDVNAETKEITKSDIFTKRTIKPVTEITHVETPQEAMQVSMDVRGKVDIFATGTPVAGLQQLNAKFNFNSVFVGNFHNLNHRCCYLALFFERQAIPFFKRLGERFRVYFLLLSLPLIEFLFKRGFLFVQFGNAALYVVEKYVVGFRQLCHKVADFFITAGKLCVYFLDLGTRFSAFLFGNFKRFYALFHSFKNRLLHIIGARFPRLPQTTSETAKTIIVIISVLPCVIFVPRGNDKRRITAVSTLYKPCEPRINGRSVARDFVIVALFVLNSKPSFAVNQALVISDFYKRLNALSVVAVSVQKQPVNTVIRAYIIKHFHTLRREITVNLRICTDVQGAFKQARDLCHVNIEIIFTDNNLTQPRYYGA